MLACTPILQSKSANENAVVLIGGLGYDDFEDGGGTFSKSFLPKVLQEFGNGGDEIFDMMNFHYFPVYSPSMDERRAPA